MKTVRNTAAKSEILDIISKSKPALSHSEIQAALSVDCDRVTIYRVLERLLTEEAIHKVVNIDGVVKYASCNACAEKHNHNHVHFSCEKCKSVTCLKNVIPVFQLPKKYKAREINFMVAGLCPDCV